MYSSESLSHFGYQSQSFTHGFHKKEENPDVHVSEISTFLGLRSRADPNALLPRGWGNLSWCWILWAVKMAVHPINSEYQLGGGWPSKTLSFWQVKISLTVAFETNCTKMDSQDWSCRWFFELSLFHGPFTLRYVHGALQGHHAVSRVFCWSMDDLQVHKSSYSTDVHIPHDPWISLCHFLGVVIFFVRFDWFWDKFLVWLCLFNCVHPFLPWDSSPLKACFGSFSKLSTDKYNSRFSYPLNQPIKIRSQGTASRGIQSVLTKYVSNKYWYNKHPFADYLLIGIWRTPNMPKKHWKEFSN